MLCIMGEGNFGVIFPHVFQSQLLKVSFFLLVSSTASFDSECQTCTRVWACLRATLWQLFCLFTHPSYLYPGLVSSEAQTLFSKVVLVLLIFLHFLADSRLRWSSFRSKTVGFLFEITVHLKASLWKISSITILSILIQELVWFLIYFCYPLLMSFKAL